MLEAKLQIEFDYLSAQGWLNVDAETARQMQTRLLADLYNKVKITIEANKMCASTAPTAAQIRLSHQLLWQHVSRIKGVRIVQSFPNCDRECRRWCS